MTAAPDKTKQKDKARQNAKIERATELSEQLLDQVAIGRRNAIEAVRKFMKSADRAVPAIGSGPTRRSAVIDAALEMSERLVKVEHDLARGVVHSAGETLSGASGRK